MMTNEFHVRSLIFNGETCQVSKTWQVCQRSSTIFLASSWAFNGETCQVSKTWQVCHCSATNFKSEPRLSTARPALRRRPTKCAATAIVWSCQLPPHDLT
jgi:hypothetical protein